MDERGRIHKLILSLVLAAMTLAVFSGVIHYGFMFLDDYGYVVHNHALNKGVSLEGVRWAFTQFYMCNWHPLTWISHMLDVEFFGMKPGMFHLVNLMFHVLNTVLLFLVLEKMTGAMWKSAAVAALFAVHPMHVESVVWISERKDVLSALFWLLTMGAYVRYVQARSVGRYLPVMLFFALGLLSKPMLVTLPFVLMLMDLWPLNRLGLFTPGETGSGGADAGSAGMGQTFASLALEKVPLLALVLVSSGITFFAQSNWGATASTYMIPLGMRIQNVITSYVAYIWKMAWPFKLAIFYPYPASFETLNVALCLLALVLVTAACLALVRRYPYLAFGWLWYAGTLVPVIGIVQVGGQSMADRYTYIPYVGLFIMAVWGVSGLLGNLRNGKLILGGLAAAVFAVLLPATWVQVGHWKDDESLVRHALAVTENNYMAHTQLGTILLKRDLEGAISEYEKALSTKLVPEAYEGLGRAYLKKNDTQKAMESYAQGLAINPKNISLQLSMGVLLARTGDIEGAIGHFNEVLKIDPGDMEACFNLGKAHLQAGRTQEAIVCFKRVLRMDPGQPAARKYLDKATRAQEGFSAELERIQGSLKSNPDDPALHVRLGDIRLKMGRHGEAIASYERALKLRHKDIPAMYGIALAHAGRGGYDDAIAMLKDISALQPGNPDHYYNIACMLARQGKKDESVSWLKSAIEKGFKNIGLIWKDPDLANIQDTRYVRELMEQNKDAKSSR